MKKLTIADASTEIGISKEAIHNRIRRGSLECVIEDGVKFVILDENTKLVPKRVTTPKKVINTNDKYYALLEEQNLKLQEKVEQLELETRSLRDQKEQMLISEKEKIEDIYLKKDEQLKSILTAINSNAVLNAPQKEVHDIEILEVNDIDEEEVPVSLKKYLKTKNISKKQQKKLIKKVNKIAIKDHRIISIGDKNYIKPLIYDYSDLLGDI